MIKRAIIRILIFLVGISILINSSLWFPLRSYVVMYFYSKIHENESLLKKNDINFQIPGGLSTKKKDWYPFVMVFNDNKGFSRHIGSDVSLTILYNFGHFISKAGSSSYYNPNSEYFSSFYGGHLVKSNTKNKIPFGFYSDREINVEEVASVPKYDLEILVLRSLGCPRDKIRFDFSVDSIEYNKSYVNHENWTKIDSTIITNSPIHKYKKDYTAYIQYGRPTQEYYRDEDFPLITLKGRTYVKYFKDYDMTIFLYVLAPDIETIEECDKNILSKTILNKKS